MALRTTYSERLAAMARLQQTTWDLLRANPQGYAHFLAGTLRPAPSVPPPPPDPMPPDLELLDVLRRTASRSLS